MVTILLVGGIGIRSRHACTDVRITYALPQGGKYVDSLRIASLLGGNGLQHCIGKPLQQLDLNHMEQSLEKDAWIRDADIYLDRAHVLHIRIEEQQPVARIFTRMGHSFYIDSLLKRIPLNPLYAERLPVFTGMPVSLSGQQARDTQHLRQAWEIVRYLQSDPLSMAMVDQADFEATLGFVLTPKLGDHRIILGYSTDIADKFRRLRIFYKQVMTQTGWNSYQEIDLRFQGQVVAIPSDSTRLIMAPKDPLPTDTLPLPETAAAIPQPVVTGMQQYFDTHHGHPSPTPYSYLILIPTHRRT